MLKDTLDRRTAKYILCFSFVLVLVLTPFMFSPLSGDLTPSVAQAATGSTADPCVSVLTTPSACYKEFMAWNNNTNVFGSLLRPVFASLAALIIQLAIVAMQVASGLFDTLVTRTIIHFGDTNGLLNTGVIQAINVAWSAFRDLANILIIGFFTFIAINIILGSPTFGQKKLIANVLIVAILINFSLLFTKIIIDFSNYTAAQFYTASIGGSLVAGAGGGANTPEGIGDRFLRVTKATSFSDSAKSIDQVGQVSGNWFMLLYALVMFILISAVAAVLFYGSFLLISRAILLIFLMVTAALAFATYLVPSNSPLNHWEAWWRSLIQSAVLAPVIILFLWATLRVSQSLQTQGTLGDLANHPHDASNLGALFSYLLIVGLLFATFKIASSFSMSVGGLNWASIPGAMTVAGGTRLAGFLGQQAGLRASRRLSAAGDRVKSDSKMALLGKGALYGGAAGAAALALGSRGGGGAPGAVIGRQISGTGLGRKEIFPSRSALPGAAAAQQVASQSAAKAIKAALAGSKDKQTAPKTQNTGNATPPKPPAGPTTTLPPRGGSVPLPPSGSSSKPAPAPKPVPTPPGAGALHAPTSGDSGIADTINKERAATVEAAKEAATATQEDHKAVAAEIKEAVGAAGAAAGTSKDRELVTALKEEMGAQRTAMKEAVDTQTEKLGGKLEHVGSQIETAAGGNRETLIGLEKTVRDVGKETAEIGSQQIEATKSENEEVKRGAVASHTESEVRLRTSAQGQRIAGAQEVAQRDTERFATLTAQQKMKDFGFSSPNTSTTLQSTQMTPANLGGSARFAAQPYSQVNVAQSTPGIPLHQEPLNTDALLKEIRENRDRTVKQILQGGKNTPPIQQ